MKTGKFIVLTLFFSLSISLCSPLLAVDEDYLKKVRSEKYKRAIVFETLAGIWGPFTTTGKLIGMEAGLPLSMILFFIMPETVMQTYPVTVPFGVDVAGEYFKHKRSFWGAFLGGLLADGIYYALTSEDPGENMGTLQNYYLVNVVGSVIGYNLFKFKSGPEKKPEEAGMNLLSQVYITKTGYSDNLTLNLRLFEAKF